MTATLLEPPDVPFAPASRLLHGDVALNYRIAGQGARTLVLVHGVGSYAEAWDGVVGRLASDFRILSFDLRGHGASSRVKGRYEIDDFVDDVLALANEVEFEQFDLAGFSLGGLIAQKLALAFPERVRRLVLLATVAGRTPEERERVAARLAALQAGEPGAHYDASLSRWLTEGFQQRHPDLVAMLRARNAANDPACYAAAYRVLAETDLGDALPAIACPTLIATGEDDLGSNPRMARFMHQRIAGSRLEILAGLRHSLLMEAPDQVATLMRGFLLAPNVEQGS
jgi:3-oxoadipate enol-lactonase